jgi:deoxyribodipyrimidine photo-lyase
VKNQQFEKALFIFRRDLRLEDNTGLIFALENAKEVIVCFIFTPEQIEGNSYRSDHCLQFMIESLQDLEKRVRAKKGKLYLFYGKPEQIVAKCIDKLGVDAVIVNQDYTPYSIKRDSKIKDTCQKSDVFFASFEDLLLHPVHTTLKADGKPYTIFTPFYKNASRLKVVPPLANRHKNYYSRVIPFAEGPTLYKKILPQQSLQEKGGRTAALKILKKLKAFHHYKAMRDFPAVNGTTHLSPHLKFTTCSPREVYHAIVQALGVKSELIRSLYWRDFFTSIAFYFPHVFKGAFHRKFDRLKWNGDKKLFKRWCEGKTGFPIIDAGMREMNQTGYMHNRVRMLVSAFLVKDLHLNWQWGEKYFAQKLIDYDPAVNNGNWQWAASTGCDAQPYFRIFNPWTQALKFDRECLYIKRWVPELSSLPAATIHAWHQNEHHKKCPSYPPPLVEHSKEAHSAISSYKLA